MRGHMEWQPTPNAVSLFEAGIELPAPDNTPEELKILSAANERFRQIPWPSPFDRTTHALRPVDAHDLSHVADESVHPIITSPHYRTLEDYKLAEVERPESVRIVLAVESDSRACEGSRRPTVITTCASSVCDFATGISPSMRGAM